MEVKTAATPWRLGHRAGLDGARGLAILLVVVGHVLSGEQAAAPIGVTLFFVLSGFLITSLIWEEKTDTGRVSLRNFYERRIRRLAPAFFVCWAVVIVTMIVVGQAATGLFGGALAASYVGNWVVATGTFLGPFNHTWSLAVEEQFYLLWPLALLVAVRFLQSRTLVVVLLTAAAAVEVARLWLWVDNSIWETLAFRTDLQADGLLIGSALAIVMHVRPFSVPAIARPACLAALLTISFIVPAAMYYGSFEAIAVMVSALLIAAIVSPGPNDVIFGNVGMIKLGLISYGLYLWHYPVLWLLGFFDKRPWPGLVVGAIGIGISLALAIASYVWVEARFRKAPSPRQHQAPIAITAPAT